MKLKSSSKITQQLIKYLPISLRIFRCNKSRVKETSFFSSLCTRFLFGFGKPLRNTFIVYIYIYIFRLYSVGKPSLIKVKASRIVMIPGKFEFPQKDHDVKKTEYLAYAEGMKVEDLSNSSEISHSADQIPAEQKRRINLSYRDVKVLFLVLTMSGLAVFLVVPVISLVSLAEMNYEILNVVAPDVKKFIQYFTLMLDTDEIAILLSYYSFLGKTELTDGIISILDNCVESSIAMLNEFCSLLESCKESELMGLNNSYYTFVNTSFPAFEEEVATRLSTLKSYTTDSGLRDTLFNSEVSTDTQADFSRATFMVSQAQLMCFLIDSCWESADVQTYFSKMESQVGDITGSLMSTVNDIFSVIEDPRLGGDTAETILNANIQRNDDRTDFIEDIRDDCEKLNIFLNDLRDISAVPNALKPLFFVLGPDWVNSLMGAVMSSLDYVTKINLVFLETYGITTTSSTRVESALNHNPSNAEVMSLAQSLHSYFALDVGSGLTIVATPQEEEANREEYEKNIFSFINVLQDMVKTLYKPTFETLYDHVSEKLRNKKHIQKLTIPTLILCSIVSFVLYFLALVVLRFYLEESGFSFHALLLAMLVMYVLQVVMSVIIVIEANLAPGNATHFSIEYEEKIDILCRDLAEVISPLTKKAVLSGLLIGPDYTTVQDEFDYFAKMLPTWAGTYMDKPWYSLFFKMVQLFQNIGASGSLSVRHGLTAASSLQFTTLQLLQDFGLTGIDGGPITASPSCSVMAGAASMAQINSNFFSISAVRERLALGNVLMNKDVLENQFASASLETNCLLNYIQSQNGKPSCYVPSICSEPQYYGLLRSTDEYSSVYSLFNPFSETGLGDLFTTLNSLRESLYAELGEIYSEANGKVEADAHSVVLVRRFIMWGGFLTFLVNLIGFLLLRSFVFGHSFFSMFA